MFYVRLAGTERYISFNGAFWGYSQYYYANCYKTIKSTKLASEKRSKYLSKGKALEVVSADTLEAIPLFA